MSSFNEFIENPLSEKILLAHIHAFGRIASFSNEDNKMSKKVKHFVIGVRIFNNETNEIQILNPNEFSFDPKTQILTINQIFDKDVFEVVAEYIFFFSNNPISLPYDLDKGEVVEYEPRIVSVPQFKSSMATTNKDNNLINKGNLVLENNDGYFISFFNSLVFEEKRVSIYYYNPQIEVKESKQIFRGRITGKSYSKNITFNCSDDLFDLSQNIPQKSFEESSVEEDRELKKRIIYGEVDGLLCLHNDKYPEQTPLLDNNGNPIFINIKREQTVFVFKNGLSEEIAIGDTLVLGSDEYSIDDFYYLNNTYFIKTNSVDFNQNNVPVSVKFDKGRTKYNREYIVSEHKIFKPTAQIIEKIDKNKFRIDKVEGFDIGDYIELNNRIQKIKRISRDIIYLTTDAQYSMNDVITLKEAWNVYYDQNKIQYEDYQVVQDNDETKIILSNNTEFNSAKINDFTNYFYNHNGAMTLERKNEFSMNVAKLDFVHVPYLYIFKLPISKDKTNNYIFCQDKIEDISKFKVPFPSIGWSGLSVGTNFFIYLKPLYSQTEPYEVGQEVLFRYLDEASMEQYEKFTITEIQEISSTGRRVYVDGNFSRSYKGGDVFTELDGNNILVDKNDFNSFISKIIETTTELNLKITEIDNGLNYNIRLTLLNEEEFLEDLDLKSEWRSSYSNRYGYGYEIIKNSSLIIYQDLNRFFDIGDYISFDRINWSKITEVSAKYLRHEGILAGEGTIFFKKIKIIDNDSKLTVSCYGKMDKNEEFIDNYIDIILNLLEMSGLKDYIDYPSFEKHKENSYFLPSLKIPEDFGAGDSDFNSVINKINKTINGSIILNNDLTLSYKTLDKNIEDLRTINEDDIISYSINFDNFDSTQKVRGNFNQKDYDTNKDTENTHSTFTFENIFTKLFIGNNKVKEEDFCLIKEEDVIEATERASFLSSLSNAKITIDGSLVLAKYSLGEFVVLGFENLYQSIGYNLDSKRIGIITELTITGEKVKMVVQDLGSIFQRFSSVVEDTEPDFEQSNSEQKVINNFIVDDDGLIEEDENGNSTNLIS